MSVRVNGDVIHLEGNCRVEEAETFLLALQEGSASSIDVSKLESMHMAVAQVLAVAQAEIIGLPGSGFVREQLLPALSVIGRTNVIGDSAADF